MRFAYADPPYLGSASRYKEHPEWRVYDTIEGHRALVSRLVTEFPDGWALSMSSVNLRDLFPLCPEDCRVAAWVKPFAAFKPNVNPGYTWEPVVFRGGRRRDRFEPTIRDHLAENITLKRGLVGAKPLRVCLWICDLLGYRDGDELIDLFPGTNAMRDAIGARP